MEKLGQCQVEGCSNPAEYGLYRTNPKGEKEWLWVCRFHEGQVGYENMRRAGGYYERKKLEEEDSFNAPCKLRR